MSPKPASSKCNYGNRKKWRRSGGWRGAARTELCGFLLAFAGYKVTREYYINDAGGQVDTLARSVFLRYFNAAGAARLE